MIYYAFCRVGVVAHRLSASVRSDNGGRVRPPYRMRSCSRTGPQRQSAGRCAGHWKNSIVEHGCVRDVHAGAEYASNTSARRPGFSATCATNAQIRGGACSCYSHSLPRRGHDETIPVQLSAFSLTSVLLSRLRTHARTTPLSVGSASPTANCENQRMIRGEDPTN